MEDHDDFEIVDNEKSGFEELVEEDALHAMSEMNKEKAEMQELKQESAKLLKKLREQSAANAEYEAKLKEEMKSVSELKLSLQAQKEELAQLLDTMRKAPSAVSKSQSLLEQLNAFYTDTSSMQQELSKLKGLRVQQEQMMNECKIHIETINSNQRECVVSLDKSKSFACKECGTDIALKDEIESKCYQVGQGQFTEKKRGYLFCNAVNLVLGASKTEVFTTGSYQISWTSCAKCHTQMGWKYISADNPNNNAKVGKYCLARYSLTSPEDRAQQNDLQRQKSSHGDVKTKLEEQNIRLHEQLEHALSDVRHLTQLSQQQRDEIASLEMQNETISKNAGETIDDLSAELAEEKDGHSNLKHKYQKMREQFTAVKIKYDRRGTELETLKKRVKERDAEIVALSNKNEQLNVLQSQQLDSSQKQQMKSLHRQLSNLKDEMQGISKHLDHCKAYLKNTTKYLERSALLRQQDELNVDEIYTLCKSTRQFLGNDELPPKPVSADKDKPFVPPLPLPRDPSVDALPMDDDAAHAQQTEMPREPTPELKVSQREVVALSPPAATDIHRQSATPPPSLPAMQPSSSLSSPPGLPSSPAVPPSIDVKPKINHKANMPPSIPSIPSTPTEGSKPQIPLPRPKTPQHNAKSHNMAVMPQSVHVAPALPAPMMPPSYRGNDDAPSMPHEVRSEHARHFSSAMQPPSPSKPNVFFPAPKTPNPHSSNVPSVPSIPETPPPVQQVAHINANPHIPDTLPPPAPRSPSHHKTAAIPSPAEHDEHGEDKPKMHSAGMMPSSVAEPRVAAPPDLPSSRMNEVNEAPPHLPEVRSSQQYANPRTFSSTMQVPVVASPPVPRCAEPAKLPSSMAVPPAPSSPVETDSSSLKTKINNRANMPPPMAMPATSMSMAMAAPPAPRDDDDDAKQQRAKLHHLGVMPAASIVDEKRADLSCVAPPSAPKNIHDNIAPMLPQEREEEEEEEEKEPQMESMKSAVLSHNDDTAPMAPKMQPIKAQPKKPKIKKVKSKKKQKKGDDPEAQKRHLTEFFTLYSDSLNWKEGGKEKGVQKYILQFADREPLHARMAFLYSMTLYLGQIVGVNKRCITHAFMLFKSVRAQIDTLCEEFALILQTLEHHNDDKLWKYVYSFLYNAAAYFKHISKFVGRRIDVGNQKKYHKKLTTTSLDESSFRRHSNLSVGSGVSGHSFDAANDSNISAVPPFNPHDSLRSNVSTASSAHPSRHMVYGDAYSSGKYADNRRKKSNKSQKKKKKSSSSLYAQNST